MENPNLNWMMPGATPIYGNPNHLPCSTSPVFHGPTLCCRRGSEAMGERDVIRIRAKGSSWPRRFESFHEKWVILRVSLGFH